jgi:hypothetical protein
LGWCLFHTWREMAIRAWRSHLEELLSPLLQHDHAWAARFRRLARDDARLAEPLAGVHCVAFVILMRKRAQTFHCVMTSTCRTRSRATAVIPRATIQPRSHVG